MTSEVIDLYNPDVTCKSWPDHPLGTFGAVGGLIDDQLIICGGFAYYAITRKCYAMTPISTYNASKLDNATYQSAGVVLNQDTLLVSGGYDSYLHIFDRIEYISEVENGHDPDSLPVGLYGHCLIRITNETLLLTGGKNATM